MINVLSSAAFFRRFTKNNVFASVLLAMSSLSFAEAAPSDYASTINDLAEAGQALALTRFDLNDVSFLYPLPESARDFDYLLGATSPALGGLLVPESVRTPPTSIFGKAMSAEHRIIAARVDHCFPGTEEKPCVRQIRLTADAVVENPETGIVSTTDQPIHLFYELTNSAFKELVSELRALKALANGETDGKALSVNPVMKKEGLDGPYARKLNDIIARFAGEENLVRIADMNLGGKFTGSSSRVFFQRDLNENFLPIPGTLTGGGEEAVTQAVFSQVGNRFGFLTVGPRNSKFELLWRHQTNDLGPFLNEPTQTEIEEAVNDMFRIDNPKLSDVTNTDCVSCHIAERVRKAVVENPESALSEMAFTNEFKNRRYDLTPTHNGLDIIFEKMFGYSDTAPSVSVRVANETSIVARALSQARFQVK